MSTPSILYLGDSRTHHMYLSHTTNSTRGVQMNGGKFVPLDKENWYALCGGAYSWFNGSTAKGKVAQKFANNDAAVISMGANDITGTSVNIDDLVNKYAAYAEEMAKQGKPVYITSINPEIGTGSNEGGCTVEEFNRRAQEFNKKIAARLANTPGVTYIDTYQFVWDHGTGQAADATGLHYKASLYNKIYNEVTTQITNHYTRTYQQTKSNTFSSQSATRTEAVSTRATNVGGSAMTSNSANIYVIGDSRTVHMAQTAGVGDGAQNANGVSNANGVRYFAKTSQGYDWFNSNLSAIKNDAADRDPIVIALGANDLYNSGNYLAKIKELAKGAWKGKQIYFTAVTPFGPTYSANSINATQVNKLVDDFNSKMQQGMSGLSNVHFVDTNTWFKKNCSTTVKYDVLGMHYDAATNRALNNCIITTVQNDYAQRPHNMTNVNNNSLASVNNNSATRDVNTNNNSVVRNASTDNGRTYTRNEILEGSRYLMLAEIAQHEGFITKAQYDVNGYAIGFGNHHHGNGSPVQQSEQLTSMEVLRGCVNHQLNANIKDMQSLPVEKLPRGAVVAISGMMYNCGNNVFKNDARLRRALENYANNPNDVAARNELYNQWTSHSHVSKKNEPNDKKREQLHRALLKRRQQELQILFGQVNVGVVNMPGVENYVNLDAVGMGALSSPKPATWNAATGRFDDAGIAAYCRAANNVGGESFNTKVSKALRDAGNPPHWGWGNQFSTTLSSNSSAYVAQQSRGSSRDLASNPRQSRTEGDDGTIYWADDAHKRKSYIAYDNGDVEYFAEDGATRAKYYDKGNDTEIFYDNGKMHYSRRGNLRTEFDEHGNPNRKSITGVADIQYDNNGQMISAATDRNHVIFYQNGYMTTTQINDQYVYYSGNQVQSVKIGKADIHYNNGAIATTVVGDFTTHYDNKIYVDADDHNIMYEGHAITGIENIVGSVSSGEGESATETQYNGDIEFLNGKVKSVKFDGVTVEYGENGAITTIKDNDGNEIAKPADSGENTKYNDYVAAANAIKTNGENIYNTATTQKYYEKLSPISYIKDKNGNKYNVVNGQLSSVAVGGNLASCKDGKITMMSYTTADNLRYTVSFDAAGKVTGVTDSFGETVENETDIAKGAVAAYRTMQPLVEKGQKALTESVTLSHQAQERLGKEKELQDNVARAVAQVDARAAIVVQNSGRIQLNGDVSIENGNIVMKNVKITDGQNQEHSYTVHCTAEGGIDNIRNEATRNGVKYAADGLNFEYVVTTIKDEDFYMSRNNQGTEEIKVYNGSAEKENGVIYNAQGNVTKVIVNGKTFTKDGETYKSGDTVATAEELTAIEANLKKYSPELKTKLSAIEDEFTYITPAVKKEVTLAQNASEVDIKKLSYEVEQLKQNKDQYGFSNDVVGGLDEAQRMLGGGKVKGAKAYLNGIIADMPDGAAKTAVQAVIGQCDAYFKKYDDNGNSRLVSLDDKGNGTVTIPVRGATHYAGGKVQSVDILDSGTAYYADDGTTLLRTVDNKGNICHYQGAKPKYIVLSRKDELNGAKIYYDESGKIDHLTHEGVLIRRTDNGIIFEDAAHNTLRQGNDNTTTIELAGEGERKPKVVYNSDGSYAVSDEQGYTVYYNADNTVDRVVDSKNNTVGKRLIGSHPRKEAINRAEEIKARVDNSGLSKYEQNGNNLNTMSAVMDELGDGSQLLTMHQGMVKDAEEIRAAGEILREGGNYNDISRAYENGNVIEDASRGVDSQPRILDENGNGVVSLEDNSVVKYENHNPTLVTLADGAKAHYKGDGTLDHTVTADGTEFYQLDEHKADIKKDGFTYHFVDERIAEVEKDGLTTVFGENGEVSVTNGTLSLTQGENETTVVSFPLPEGKEKAPQVIYGSDGRVSQVIDADGNTITYTYNEKGKAEIEIYNSEGKEVKQGKVLGLVSTNKKWKEISNNAQALIDQATPFRDNVMKSGMMDLNREDINAMYEPAKTEHDRIAGEANKQLGLANAKVNVGMIREDLVAQLQKDRKNMVWSVKAIPTYLQAKLKELELLDKEAKWMNSRQLQEYMNSDEFKRRLTDTNTRDLQTYLNSSHRRDDFIGYNNHKNKYNPLDVNAKYLHTGNVDVLNNSGNGGSNVGGTNTNETVDGRVNASDESFEEGFANAYNALIHAGSSENDDASEVVNTGSNNNSNAGIATTMSNDASSANLVGTVDTGEEVHQPAKKTTKTNNNSNKPEQEKKSFLDEKGNGQQKYKVNTETWTTYFSGFNVDYIENAKGTKAYYKDGKVDHYESEVSGKKYTWDKDGKLVSYTDGNMSLTHNADGTRIVVDSRNHCTATFKKNETIEIKQKNIYPENTYDTYYLKKQPVRRGNKVIDEYVIDYRIDHQGKKHLPGSVNGLNGIQSNIIKFTTDNESHFNDSKNMSETVLKNFVYVKNGAQKSLQGAGVIEITPIERNKGKQIETEKGIVKIHSDDRVDVRTDDGRLFTFDNKGEIESCSYTHPKTGSVYEFVPVKKLGSFMAGMVGEDREFILKSLTLKNGNKTYQARMIGVGKIEVRYGDANYIIENGRVTRAQCVSHGKEEYMAFYDNGYDYAPSGVSKAQQAKWHRIAKEIQEYYNRNAVAIYANIKKYSKRSQDAYDAYNIANNSRNMSSSPATITRQNQGR